MAFIYRYIDLSKPEVIYIGKVTSPTEKPNIDEESVEPLRKRDEQHQREDWYKEIGDENIVLQYIVVSHTDADILETWLINYYCKSGQLVNKAKTNWGDSSMDLYPVFGGKWRNYGSNCKVNKDRLHALADSLYNRTEGLLLGRLEYELEIFCDEVRKISNKQKANNRLNRWNMQDDFSRSDIKYYEGRI